MRKRFTRALSHLGEVHFSYSSPCSLPFSPPHVDINKYLNKYVHGDKETNLSCRRIPNNLCRYFTLTEAESHSLLLKCGLCIVTSSPEVQYGKGEHDNFTVEKHDKHCFIQVIKVSITSDVMLIVCTLDMM